MNAKGILILWACALATGCGAGVQRSGSTTTPANHATTQPRQVQGEEFRVVGRPNGDGDAYDATMLFDRATAAVRERRCDAALVDYDRIVREFPTSRVTPVAYYNRGVCYQSMRRWDEAVASLRETIARTQERELVRDAWFRLAVIGENAEPQRPELVVEATNAVLALPQISLTDRVEATARQAAAVLARGDRPGATRLAEQAIALAPTAEAVSALQDDSFIAQARFVIAEATRQESVAIPIDVNDPQLETAIERRVGLVMHAHVQFNDAIRVNNVHWAAASGFRIGEMYGDLYNAIVNAPVPADWDANAVSVYRRRTSTRLRPLLTGAMRAWEATLAMARRNGIDDNEWVRRADRQLQSLREMILNNGTPPAAGSSTTPARAPNPSGPAG